MRAKGSGLAGLAGIVGLATGLLSASLACSHAPPPAPGAPAPAAPGAPPPCATPEPLRIGLTASTRLNPGEKGEALATVVRLYQLKGVAKLTGVSFDDLLDHDKETLGEDFLSVQEVTINPGEKQEPPTVRNPDAHYLFAVALFRQPTGTTWKVTTKLNSPDPDYCHKAAAPKGARTNDSAVRLFLDENRIELR
jgi:type VI secretion system VasD/TssJ family lipoprotein